MAVVAYDVSDEIDVDDLRAAGAVVSLGGDGTDLLEGVGLLVKSPGVPTDAPIVVAARRHGIPIVSEVELAAQLLANPLLGITGTNGKTTTTALLGAMFTAAGVPAEVAGNIGRPLVELVGEVAESTWIVCELSSFQLEDIAVLRPRIAVLLNLEPDHLDRHGSFEAYRTAKLRIFENQGRGDVAIVPAGYGPTPGEARRIEFSGSDPLPAEPLIPGAHNRENAAAATAAARAAGLPEAAIAEALRTFPGVEHRIEEIATVAGVRYVNDSKATNVAAALRALASFPGVRKHVILGGRGKTSRMRHSRGPSSRRSSVRDRRDGRRDRDGARRGGSRVHALRRSRRRGGGGSARGPRGRRRRALAGVCELRPVSKSYEHRGEEFGKLVQKLQG